MNFIKVLLMTAVMVCVVLAFQIQGGQEVKINVDGGALYGELIHSTKDVLVIMVAGSGQTNRDGNSEIIPGENNSFRYLAEELKDQGISSFRYDKRSAGKSAAEFDQTEQVYFEMFVDDLQACVQEMKARGYEKIILAGHSQGSLISILAAQDCEVDGIISIAGSGYPIGEVMLKQYAPLGDDSVQIRTMKALIEGRISEDAVLEDPMLSVSNQLFLLSWMKYDPATEITKLEIPMLLLQGESDLQVSVDNVVRLAEASPIARTVMIANMNHVLKEVKDIDENVKSYQDPSFPLPELLTSSIVEFVSEIKNDN